MAGCVLRLATTMCGKADQVERVSRDVVGGIARASVSSDVLVQLVNVTAFLHRWYFGKGVLLIWMLAASCFHEERKKTVSMEAVALGIFMMPS